MRQRLMALSGALMLVLLGSVYWYLATPTRGARPLDDPSRNLVEPLWPVPDFELLNSEGLSVTSADLRGRTWLAAFIFTRCPGPCPLISRRMSQIQERLRGIEDFRLVSFSVDPDYDRPEVLRAYARQWNADPERWWFLTEDDPGEIAAIARDFKIALQRSEDGGARPSSITHGTSLLLVDRAGQVRAVFRSSDPDVVDQVVHAVTRLEP